MLHLIPIVAIIGFFSAVITFVYMHYKSRHLQRMALIDSSQNADIFFEKKRNDKYSALKLGILLVFGGLGFFIGMMIDYYGPFRIDAVFPIAFTLIGSGLGLLVYYGIVSKRDDD